MAKLIGAQRMVLQAIFDLPKDASDCVTDAKIAQATQISLGDVRTWLETLEGDGNVNVVRRTAGFSASITAHGKLALGQYRPFQVPGGPASQTSTTSVISDDFSDVRPTVVPGVDKAGGLASGSGSPGQVAPPAAQDLATAPKASGPVRLFYSYSHKDEKLREKLQEHLALLQRQGVIEGWHDRRIGAGEEWKGAIDKNVDEAQVILLLVSSSFLASNYCYDIETKRAIERHDRGEARVIPVILRPCDWHGAPFGKLLTLPTDAKPVTDWRNRDQAWTDVTIGIRRAVEALTANPQLSPPRPDSDEVGLPEAVPESPAMKSVNVNEEGRPLGFTISPNRSESAALSGTVREKLNYCRYCKRPVRGDYCMNCGVRVSGKDWSIEVTGSDASEVESVVSNLWATKSSESGASQTEKVPPPRTNVEADHGSNPSNTVRENNGFQVVLLIHGIRTQAEWQAMVRDKIAVPGKIDVIPIKYGYFDAFRFWFPFWTRRRPVEHVYTQIRVALQKARKTHPEARLSIIAHSFGTYVIGEILRQGFDLQVHRLILCGCVLPEDYPWHQFQGRFDDNEVVNECGKADIWPVLAKSLSWGYGASGTHGFGAVLVKDRFHAGGHGQYFEPEFVEKYWEPFMRRGEYQGTEFETKMPPTPWWMSVLGILPLKWMIPALAGTVLVIAAIPILHSGRSSSIISKEDSDRMVDILRNLSSEEVTRAASLSSIADYLRSNQEGDWADVLRYLETIDKQAGKIYSSLEADKVLVIKNNVTYKEILELVDQKRRIVRQISQL